MQVYTIIKYNKCTSYIRVIIEIHCMLLNYIHTCNIIEMNIYTLIKL